MISSTDLEWWKGQWVTGRSPPRGQWVQLSLQQSGHQGGWATGPAWAVYWNQQHLHIITTLTYLMTSTIFAYFMTSTKFAYYMTSTLFQQKSITLKVQMGQKRPATLECLGATCNLGHYGNKSDLLKWPCDLGGHKDFATWMHMGYPSGPSTLADSMMSI